MSKEENIKTEKYLIHGSNEDESSQGMRVLWSDKRRWFFGKLKFSFTEYSLTREKLYIDSGMIMKRRDEIRLYRVLDVSVMLSLYDRFFKTGTIIVASSDQSCPKLRIEKIKDAYNVAEFISELVENDRKDKQIRSTEFID